MLDIALIVIWAVVTVAIAWFAKRPFRAFAAGVLLSAPLIGFWMWRDGVAPTGGILHAFCGGGYSLLFHFLFRAVKMKRKK
jgi:CHASE2 domain-containing sensor protein